MAKKMTMEQGFDRLSVLIDKMEQESISLEESFDLYKEGIGLVKELRQKLDETEKQIILLEKE